jgi:hypothetical protein
MNRSRTWIAISLVFVLFLTIGCGNSEVPKAKQVIRDNLKAAENENVEAFMDTRHPESPQFERTRMIMKRTFETYKLSYEVRNLSLDKKTDDEIHLKFTQVTRKESGPKFRDNKLQGVHILRKDDGKWKIYKTEKDQVEYLD